MASDGDEVFFTPSSHAEESLQLHHDFMTLVNQVIEIRVPNSSQAATGGPNPFQ